MISFKALREGFLAWYICFVTRHQKKTIRESWTTSFLSRVENRPSRLFQLIEAIEETGDDILDALSRRLQRELKEEVLNEQKLHLSRCEGVESAQSNDHLEKARQRLLRRRLLGFDHLPRAYVGPSTIAGRGLFAKVDIAEGSWITCYPGDALVVFSEQDLQWGDHVNKDMMTDFVNPEYMLRASKDDWGIAALPELDKDPAYLGHFANDGGRPPTSPADIATYVIESNDQSNAIHQDCMGSHMVTIATCHIPKGAEILVTYGPEYWMEQKSFSTDAGTISAKSPSSKGFG